ncbi:F0F1 ATP synthase subunit gamma [candidate division KSB3 bacterium]|uniref:F0F1 ATP synthase subunit gamma n=1 Tax=candidate division KSB3 bacterium TaxID=2044937 RepID=A0A9D5JX62_9BACT|nr:F0F1 ATP synthase subunit gamma [candidate division KSB3 bacterium]MBD3325765.1 F0F1 ATP synthase subunit gamma [candidate division KSB3 bacterium]
MEQLESLKRKISSAEDLHSVVTTMKSLAAVHIREYERAVEALRDYNRTVVMGLQIVLKERPETLPISTFETLHTDHQFGAVIFGSEQGMCGQFNDHIARYALEQMERLEVAPHQRKVLALGQRVASSLRGAGQPIDEQVQFFGTAAGLGAVMQQVLFTIEDWRTTQAIEQIVLFYNKPLAGASYEPTSTHLLPLEMSWLRNLAKQPWESRTLPFYTMPWDQLFTSLLRQYFYVALYRAVVDSLASENASRLSAMQAAERSIEEHLEELNTLYQRQRQNSITVELLDIVAGFEALTGTS